MCESADILPWFYVPGIFVETILFFFIAFVIYALLEEGN